VRRIIIVSIFLAALVFSGCAPTVQLQVDRPPNWNTVGISRVAVMPFEYSRGREQAQIAEHLTATATERIRQTGHFTLISASEVDRLRSSGESLANHVDAIFTGKVMSIESNDKVTTENRKNPDTNEMEPVTFIEREVELTISYSLERTRDGSVVGFANRTAGAADKQEEGYALKSVFRLLQECRVLRGLPRDIAPYSVIETRTLMAEPNKDKALRERMKSAAALVKQKSYKSALAQYMKIYSEYGTFASIYNASIMQEALGETREAIRLMQEASSQTGNPKAREEIIRLNKRLEEQETVDTEYKVAARPIDKIIAYASGEALKILPPRSRVWIVNNARSERQLASAAADGITSALIQKGVIVVDRENSEFIESELLQQMSGSVSDSDILQAGNRTGASVIIIIAISGTGGMRRLQMRILDVESGVPIMQSDAGGNWDL